MSAIKKALFIINPKSGRKNKINIPDLIKSNIDKSIDYKIVLWEHNEQDIDAVINEAVADNVDVVIAAGGDGTVNRIAKNLIDSPTPLAIIPLGSGNGLARHLKIPLNTVEAIQLLSNSKTISIDSCFINNKPFFCTSGIGFDAHIGKLFASNTKRGFISYLKIILSEFIKYKPQEYNLNIDNQNINIKAFLITFANAGQYGNNGIIAPNADIQDGIIEITIIKPFKIRHSVGIGYRLFNKTIHHSRFVETYKGRNIIVKRKEKDFVHYDGESVEMGELIEVNIKHASLKVLVPSYINC